jgi:hypothetical protein
MQLLINKGIAPNTIGNYDNWSFPLVGKLTNVEIEDVIRKMDWKDQFIVSDPENYKLDYLVRLDRHQTCYSIESGSVDIPLSVSGLRFPEVISRLWCRITASMIDEKTLMCQLIHGRFPHNIDLHDLS